MTPIARESELQIPARKTDESRPVAEGTRLHRTYFSFSVSLPLWAIELPPVEVPDERLFQHVVWSGSLDWLADPAEDVYSLEDGEPL